MKKINILFVLTILILTSCSDDGELNELNSEVTSDLQYSTEGVQLLKMTINDREYKYKAKKNEEDSLISINGYDLELIESFFDNNPDYAELIDNEGHSKYYTDYETMIEYNPGLKPATDSNENQISTKNQISTDNQVNYGITVRFYEAAGYLGEYLDLGYSSGVAQISDMNDYGFGDIISSIECFGPDVTMSLTIWEDSRFSGKSRTFTNTVSRIKIYNLTDVRRASFSRSWNDEISSVKFYIPSVFINP